MMARAISTAYALTLSGCVSAGQSIRDALPQGSVVAPWVLEGEVWHGGIEAAAPALGEDAEFWSGRGVQQVWLAVYRDELRPASCLKVRCMALASEVGARQAFLDLRPPGAKSLDYGEIGSWTEMGVLFQQGRLVCEVFGPDASWTSQTQSALLAAFIARRITPELAGAPR
jgi:hypothetical protein